MKQTLILFGFLIGTILLLVSCEKDANGLTADQGVPKVVLDNLDRLGFSTDGVKRFRDGFLVEGDIYMDEEQLLSHPTEVRVPFQEQYHTFNLVSRTPKTLKVWVNPVLGQFFIDATEAAITRYNDELLELTFVRVTKKGGSDIQIDPDQAVPLASAGFPTNGGKPYKNILVNDGVSLPAATWTTIIAHEMGHCIGFRHTDWYDRSISCGGFPVNEGQETTGIGADSIPGTPGKNSTPDTESWMLSCIGANQDRPFTSFDQVALDYLY